MILRKDRSHQSGISNIDFRAEQYKRPEDKSRLEFLATCKSKKFEEVVKGRLLKTAPDPLATSLTYYKESDRKQKEKPQISYPRFAQLEEQELRKIVFTGESQLIYDDKLKYFEQDPLQKGEQLEKHQPSNKLIESKLDKNSKAIQETQLVGIQRNKETLEGKVDLQKVKEIRRTIRRRYANRKNFQKIYNQWDINSKGAVGSLDVLKMIKKMGININIHEARVLVASVDADKSGDLSLDEFMQLIFNDNDNLDVNLASMPVISEEELEQNTASNEVIGQLNDDAVNTKKIRHQNQVTLILKNKIQSLGHQMRLADEMKQGFLPYEKLEIILKKLGVQERIMSQDDMRWIFDTHKIDEHKFDYLNFLQRLESFKFTPEDIYKDPTDIFKQKTQIQKVITKFNETEDSQFHVYEAQKANSWHLEVIRRESRKVFRLIERYLGNKQEFENFFKQQFNIKNEQDYNKREITKGEMTKFIENIFLNVGEKDVKKFEVESFLSVFNYNSHSCTLANEISKTIYEETDQEWYKKMQWNMARPPPPDNKKFHPEFLPEELKTEGNEDNRLQTQTSQPLIKRPIESRRALSQLSLRRSTCIPNFSEQLQKILKKFEDRVFCGTVKAYDVYKQFDIDKDGYISQKDLITKIKEMNVLDNNEIKPFLSYLDPENVGYLDYHSFSSKVRVGMVDNDDQGKQVVIPFVQPGREHHEEEKRIFPNIMKTVYELRKPYYPDENRLVISTRFGASPPFQNTFINFKADPKSAMHIDTQHQFSRDQDHRILFQKEEQQKRHSIDVARVDRVKQHNTEQHNQIQQNYDSTLQKEDCKRQTKGILQWNYEHRAHLTNNWK